MPFRVGKIAEAFAHAVREVNAISPTLRVRAFPKRPAIARDVHLIFGV